MINKVTLYGTILEAAKPAYTNRNGTFYKTYIRIPRAKDTIEDVLPVILNELQNQLLEHELLEFNLVKIEGKLLSHNIMGEDGKRHLDLSIRAYDLAILNEKFEPKKASNNITLEGYLCKEPKFRETPFGKKICDLLLAVNRERTYISDYIPVICWGAVAHKMKSAKVGDRISLSGRIQSRPYSKTLPNGSVETRIAYEVSGNTVLQWNQNNRSHSDELDDFEDFTDLD